MKQLSDCACEGINTCQIGALVQIAVHTCEAKVISIIGTAMLARADVLNVERRQW